MIMRFPGLKFGIVALAVVLLTLGLAAASLPLWLEPHKDRLAALISDALGRKLELRGELRLKSLFPPALQARQVALMNPAWASRAEMISARELQLSLSPMALLAGRIEVAEGRLLGADLRLERATDNANNWQFGASGGSSSGASLPEIPRIQIDDSLLSYLEDGVLHRLELTSVSGRLGATGHFELFGDVRYRSIPMNGRYVIDFPAHEPTNYSFSFAGEGVRLAGYTEAERLLWLLEAWQSPMWERLSGLNLAADARVEVAGELRASDQGMALQQIFGRAVNVAGVNRLLLTQGSARIAEQSLTIDLQGEADAQPVSLHATLGERGKGEKRPLTIVLSSKKNSLKADGALHETRPRLTELSLLWKGERFESLLPSRIPSVPIGAYRLAAKLQIAQDQWRLQQIEGRIGKTRFGGDLRLETRQGRRTLTGELDFKRLNLRPLLSDASRQSDDAEEMLHLPLALDLAVRAKSLQLPAAELHAVQARLTLSDEQVALEDVAFRWRKQRFTGQGRQQLSGGEWDLQLAGSQLSLATLLPKSGLKGKLAGMSLELSAKGVSREAVAKSGRVQLRLQGGVVEVAGFGKQQPLRWELKQTQLKGAPGKPLQFAASGQLDGESLKLKAVGPQLAQLVESAGPLRFAFDASYPKGGASLKFDLGASDWRLQGPLQIEAKGRALPAWASRQIGLGKGWPHRLRMSLLLQKRGLRLQPFSLTLGRNQIGGRLELRRGGSRPALSGSLTSERLDLRQLFAAQSGLRGKKSQRMAERRIRLEWVSAADLELDLDFKSLRYGKSRLGKGQLRLQTKGARLRLVPIELAFSGGGTLRAKFYADPRGPQKKFKLLAHAKTLDYGQLLRHLDLSRDLDGKSDITLDLDAGARTWGGLLQSLSGDLVIVGGKAKLRNQELPYKLQDLVTTLLSQLQDEKQHDTHLNCLVSRWYLKQGVARSLGLLVDTQELTIAGSGKIDFRRDRIDMILDPRPKQLTLISFANPVAVSGPLHDPQINPTKLSVLKAIAGVALGISNPALLLVAFGDVGVGDENPCLSAYQKLERRVGVDEESNELLEGVQAELGSQMDRVGGAIWRVLSPVDEALSGEPPRQQGEAGLRAGESILDYDN
ncbi:AsmA family protein [endosymbiont of Riftia pachyptila (vent Ph05)]|uniref:AsmA family protein n=2 Tax=endosymbiont of Riftia pachyptila TaxID=54396 RepID=G2D9D8_9GAMM|nr:AsmA family protein [endosymbiont of Riftia pachyptila (vent Ph05)]